MQVSKKQAVCMLIEGAIRAQEQRDPVCAITLAGAAEEAMPPSEETLFVILTTSMGAAFDIILGSRKRLKILTAKNVLNFERNWLKHYSAEEPDPVNLIGDFVMVRRALSRFRAVYGENEMTERMLVAWNYKAPT